MNAGLPLHQAAKTPNPDDEILGPDNFVKLYYLRRKHSFRRRRHNMRITQSRYFVSPSIEGLHGGTDRLGSAKQTSTSLPEK